MDAQIEIPSSVVNTSENPTPTSEERTFAALAHGSIILFGIGIMATLVIWLTQRKKSAYVAFHALQALLYQTFQSLVMMLISLLAAIVILILSIVMIPVISNLDQNNPWIMLAVEFGIFILIFGAIGLYFLGGLVAGILCFTQHQPYYPFFGRRLERYLSDPLRGEERQERVVASACHLGVFIQFMGLVLPLVSWLAARNWSKVLRFQALQALLFRLIATIVNILFGITYMATWFLMMVSILLTGFNQNNFSPVVLVSVIIFLLVMLFWMIIFLLTPIYHTFAMVASWKVSHDQDYHYPLIGRLAEKLINRWQTKPVLETNE